MLFKVRQESITPKRVINSLWVNIFTQELAELVTFNTGMHSLKTEYSTCYFASWYPLHAQISGDELFSNWEYVGDL